MVAKTAEERAAERMVADYPVPILTSPKGKRQTVNGPVGMRPPKFRPAPPAARGAEEDDDEDPDEATAALIEALAWFDEPQSDTRDAAFESKHHRGPGGRFATMVDRLVKAIAEHKAGKGKGKGKGHPFDGFDREQLRRAAKARGITLKRGEDRDSIAAKLLADLGEPDSLSPGKPKVKKSVASPKRREGSRRIPGTDLLEQIAADFDGESKVEYEGRRRKAYDTPYDLQLAEIGRRQGGFANTPSVATRDEMDSVITKGWIELWRGVTPKGNATAADINGDFRDGPYKPGRGIYGNGYYTSVRRVTAEGYRGRDPKGNLPASGKGDFTLDDLEGTVEPDTLLRLALDPKARVADYDEMKAESGRWLGEAGWASPAVAIFLDVGRYAATRGYDAMIVRGHADGSLYPGWERTFDDDNTGGLGHADQYVIFNRSAVMVQRMEDEP